MAAPEKVTMRLGDMSVMVLADEASAFRKLGYVDAGPYHEGKGDFTEPPDAKRKATARGKGKAGEDAA